MIRRGAVLASVLLVVGAIAAVPGGAEPTSASWNAADYAAATFATANGVLAPTGLRCVPPQSALTFTIPLQWTAPTGIASYVVPSAYEVQVLDASSALVYDAHVTMTSTVLTSGPLAIGTYTIRVRGETADRSWTSTWISDAAALLSPVGYRCAA